MKTALFFVTLVAVGCGGSSTPSKYPERERGCAVQLFHEAPTMATDNIGPVSATCADDISETDCIRELEDQTCKVGGDVVWGVPMKPTRTDSEKNRWSGRAAHTK